MSWQFLAMAGLISAILLVIAIVLAFLVALGGVFYDTEYVVCRITLVCILLPIAFWLVVGTICALNGIWGWGLIK